MLRRPSVTAALFHFDKDQTARVLRNQVDLAAGSTPTLGKNTASSLFIITRNAVLGDPPRMI